MTNEDLKALVGKEVIDLVEDGMTLGLGSGTTMHYAIQELGSRLKEGKISNVRIVPTSNDTEQKAKALGIDVANINEVETIDLAIDGADEVSSDLDLIKGGGGALTREKIIAYLAERFVVIVDESKMSQILGNSSVPVEVLPFAWFKTQRNLEKIGASVVPRLVKDRPFITDNKNYIFDAKFSHIYKPAALERIINNIPGVVENGIFRHDKVEQVLVGTKKGIVVYPDYNK